MRFRHPLVRSAAYRSASPAGAAGGAPRRWRRSPIRRLDPDRRAWHRAQAAAGPDEEVAAELERSAGRAQARGGLAAAAAFLERAALLTPDPAAGRERLLAAAGRKRDAGALDAALGLLAAVEAGPLDALQAAEVEHLRGQIALERRRGGDAPGCCSARPGGSSRSIADLARETHLEALGAAMWAGDLGRPVIREAAEAARAAPPVPSRRGRPTCCSTRSRSAAPRDTRRPRRS